MSNAENSQKKSAYMGHTDQDGKKVDEKSLYFLSEKLVRTEKSNNLHNLESFYLILAGKSVPNKFSGFRRNLGCAPYAQSWVFFSKCSKYSFFVALLLSL